MSITMSGLVGVIESVLSTQVFIEWEDGRHEFIFLNDPQLKKAIINDEEKDSG